MTVLSGTDVATVAVRGDLTGDGVARIEATGGVTGDAILQLQEHTTGGVLEWPDPFHRLSPYLSKHQL
eukprot:COSAG05_NODE_22343_length_265_cov_0.921687_2_plen_67_part_01